MGVVFFVVYYLLFRFAITKFNMRTPGREPEDEFEAEEQANLEVGADGATTTAVAAPAQTEAQTKAEQLIEAFGGRDNLVNVDACIPRLRMEVADKTKGRSVTEQTGEILGIIDALLKEAGSDKGKLLSATIWLTDMGTFGEMNAVWEGWVVPGQTPARATVEAKLAAADYKVEIAVIAAI